VTGRDGTVLPVDLGERSYDVVVGPGSLATLPDAVARFAPRRVAVLTHDRLASAYPVVEDSLRAAGFDVVTLRMPEGEAAKTWATVGGLLETMAAAEMHRDDLLVAFGGGVVTDTGGFAAASFLRGIRWIGVSTTVLGAVDASVGGKTGVNLDAGKNLAGAFWQPSRVIVDTDVFATLDRRDVRSGLAEAVKCGFIDDPSILDRLESWTPEVVDDPVRHDPEGLAAVVAAGMATKIAVVTADEREGGLRAVLNYGHTFGHALETTCGYALTHGEAISVGMVFAAELARVRGMLDDDAVARHRAVLQHLGLPVQVAPEDAAAAAPLMARDKKAVASGLRFVLLDGIGNPAVVSGIDTASVQSALAAVTGGGRS
jgi:3-dehydroquinate synthase